MKNLKLLAFGMAMFLGIALSCSKNDTPDPTPEPEPTPESYFAKEGLTPNYGCDQFEDNIVNLGGLNDVDQAWIRARAGRKLTSSADDAKILVLGNSAIDANKTLLASAYSSGKFIIICNPDIDKLKSLREEFGWVFIIPDNLPKTDFAIGFASHHTILLTPPVKGNTEPIHEKDYKKAIEMNDAEYEKTSVFYSTRSLMHFIKQYKQHLPEDTKTSVDAPNLISTVNTNYYSRSVDSNLNAYIDGTDRRLKAFYSMCFEIAVYPCYIPEGVNNHGDYYNVKATATNFAPTMYEYDSNPDQAVGPRAYPHYWPYKSGEKEKSYWGDAYFLGPYNTMFNFRCYASSDPQKLKFMERPTPESDIGTTGYSKTDTKSWDVGISGGYSEGNGGSIGINLGIGGSSSNQVSYAMSDMKVINRCDNYKVEYEFEYQNVPREPVNIDNYINYDNMPVVSRSTTDFGMMWEWTTSTAKGDYDSSIIGIDYELINQVCISTRDEHGIFWYDYWNAYSYQYFFRDPGSSSPMKVGRIPIGCLHIDNKCTDGQVLYNIIVTDETGATVATSKNNIASGEYYEVLLPQKNHIYSVRFDMGKSSYDTMPYQNINPIQLSLLKSSSDKSILSATSAAGGDFETNVGMITVKNQSPVKLVRNIVVYRAVDDTPVATYDNSISYNCSANLKVNSGIDYYVTIELGSSSSFDRYRCSNFTSKQYHTETDAKILTALTTGGDFYPY